jgi:hypothetical protein
VARHRETPVSAVDRKNRGDAGDRCWRFILCNPPPRGR